VHGEIDRGTFLRGAGKFAVGGLTAAGFLAALKPNFAWAMQIQPDDKRIRTEYATVAAPLGNGSIKGYLVRPASAGAAAKVPAVIVIHENRGLNPYIEDVARRLGTLGYIAFAPDGLTSVGGYPADEEKAAALFATVSVPKMTEDFLASAAWLKARPESTGRLGAVGFCFGGGITNTRHATRRAQRAGDQSRGPRASGRTRHAARIDVARLQRAVNGRGRAARRLYLRQGESRLSQRYDTALR
jgi:carboxymethylenebutenolidase